MARMLLITGLIFTLYGCTKTGSQQIDLVIANVTLIDGTGNTAQENVNILVKEGRITGITTGESNLSSATVVDGTGKYLMPGLIDAHAHPFPIDMDLSLFPRFGVTSIFVTGCSNCSNENMQALRASGRSDTLVAPNIYHTSQHFTMEGRHPVKTYPSSNWREGETVYYVRDTTSIAEMIQEVATQPIVGIKVTIDDGPAPPFVEQIPVEFVAKIVEEAHKLDLEVFAHVSAMKGLYTAEAAGVDHLLHFIGVDIDWEKDLDVIKRLRERDASWVTTLMIEKSFFYPAHPEWMDEVEAYDVFDKEELTRLREGASVEEAMAFLQNIYGMEELTLENVMQRSLVDLEQLHEMGFNLVIGTDTGNRFIFSGLSVHEEMELMAMGAFEPLEIIRMATRNGAEMLGILDDRGTLEVGKVADMVLLDQNPLDDIRNTRAIHSVYKEGRTVFPAQ